MKTETIEKSITKLEAYALMASSKGAVFTVWFVKKDGTVRKMNCRTGATKHLVENPTRKAYERLPHLLLSVYDMQKKEYRNVNLKTMFKLKISKVTYEVI